MRSAIPVGLSALLLVGLGAGSVVAQDSPDRIDLPDGWRPEGITVLDGTRYAGSLGDGAIWAIDPTPASATGQLFAPGAEGRVTVGIDVSPDGETIWAAGGSTGEIRAYDVATGEPTTWTIEGAGFFNDVAATDDAVYVTDPFVPQIRVVHTTSSDGTATAVETLPLSGDIEYDDGFNVNGIVAASGGLIVVHSSLGALFRVDPDTGETSLIDTGDVALTGGDGLELDGEVLYVIRNSASTITALRMDEALETATLIAELTHADLDTPTTAALIGDDLWAINARFGAPAVADTEYWITRLDSVTGAEG